MSRVPFLSRPSLAAPAAALEHLYSATDSLLCAAEACGQKMPRAERNLYRLFKMTAYFYQAVARAEIARLRREIAAAKAGQP